MINAQGNVIACIKTAMGKAKPFNLEVDKNNKDSLFTFGDSAKRKSGRRKRKSVCSL